MWLGCQTRRFAWVLPPRARTSTSTPRGKRKAKKLPLIVGNLVQDGLGGDDNQVVLFDDAGRHPLPKAPKPDVARAIVAQLAGLLPKS